MKSSLRVLAAVVLASLAASAGAAPKSATVTVVNKSEWRLDQLFLSPSDDEEWGPDQLGADVVEPGASFKLTNIPCNTWDIKVVDEDGDECVIEEVDLCRDNSQWTITSKALLACQADSE